MLQCETENIIEDKPIMPINAEDVYAELYTESFPDSKLPENRIKTRDHTILPSTFIYSYLWSDFSSLLAIYLCS